MPRLIAGLSIMIASAFFAQDQGRDSTSRLLGGTLSDVLTKDPRVMAAVKESDLGALQTAVRQAVLDLAPHERAEIGPVVVLPSANFDYAELAAELQELPIEDFGFADGNARLLLTPEMLEAANRPNADADARNRAFEEAIRSLPGSLQQQLAHGYTVGTLQSSADHAAEEEPDGPRLPLPDAVLLLPHDEQAALRDHMHLIDADDERGLIRAMGSMPEEVASAAASVLATSNSHHDEVRFLAEQRRMAAAAVSRGYFESADEVSTAVLLLSRIRQHQAAQGTLASVLLGASVFSDFEPIAEYQQRHGVMVAQALSEVVDQGTEAYVGPWDGGTAVVFADSAFGAPMAVLSYPVDEVHYHVPNLTFAGRDASVSLSRHASGSWSTNVSGFDGSRVHTVHVAAKLDDVQRAELVRFARAAVERSSGAAVLAHGPLLH